MFTYIWMIRWWTPFLRLQWLTSCPCSFVHTCVEVRGRKICTGPWSFLPVFLSVSSAHSACLCLVKKDIQCLKSYYHIDLLHINITAFSDCYNKEASFEETSGFYMYCLCSTWNKSLLSMVCSNSVRFCSISVWIWSNRWRFSSSRFPFSWLNN